MNKAILVLILIINPGFSRAENCNGLDVVKALEPLVDVKRFHNCELEVVKIPTTQITNDGEISHYISYLVYGKDIFRCKTTDKCPEANFEISIKKECLDKKITSSNFVKNSNGYNLDGRMMRNHMQIIFNAHNDPMQIQFGQTDLAEAKRINYVDCKLNPLSGN